RYDLARRQTLSAALAEEEAAARLQTARASVDLATLEIRLSEDQLAVLEQRRETARVVAPFTGRFVPTVPGAPVPEIGRVLAPAEPIGTLVDVASLRLVAEIHEDDVAALHVGALAAARPLSRPGAEIVGEVRAIGAFVEPITRSVTVEALFDDPLGLPAGTSADVVLEGQPLDGAIWVDERWIGYRDGRAVVFVVGARGAEGLAVAEARELDLAPRTYDGGRLVRAGLARGDEVVTSSIELIGDGSLCRPVEAARRASTRSELGVPR
ncbi:MAG: efflux RND transporter periplasmic adaptor subunit, partial [Planctomycetota bacterium]